MRIGALVLLMATLGLVVIGVSSGKREDPQLQRVRARALELRHERDWLQHRLTRRVLEARGLRRALVHRASSLEALRLAAVAYHVDVGLLYRIASCESTGGDGLKADAKNPSSTAAGLGQFLDSTWASTPYAGFSVYSPYANALAIAREVSLDHLWQWTASRSCWS
jgi:hypothetical protein